MSNNGGLFDLNEYFDEDYDGNDAFDEEIEANEVHNDGRSVESVQNSIDEVGSTEKSPNLVQQAVNVVEAENLNNDDIVEPKVGMIFPNCESFAAFIFTYAMKKGFEVFTRSNVINPEYKAAGVSREFGGKKEPRYHMMDRLRLACKKGGRKCSENSNVTGCKAVFEGARENDGFQIKSVHLDHNHELDPANSRFTISARIITDYFKKRILLNDRAGIPIMKNFNAMVLEAGGHENLPFNRRDLRNLVNLERRLERINGDAAALEEYFVKMKADTPGFFYAIKKDNEGRLQNVFWADARCRAMFKVFGDVVTYDTTFLCNRYRLPFSPFIGVNHHGNSICFAAALITNEDTDTFIWVFERWLECMGKAPPVILSDQDKAIGKAIETVFPGTPHRLCLWHMMKNAVKNLGRYGFWKELCSDLKAVVHDTLSEEEFEQGWSVMVDKFGVHDNAWIKESYNIRKRWVPAYWRGTFCAGMSSTQRSEQANRFFKIRVSLETGLRNFMTQFDLAQQSRVEDERTQNFICKDRPVPYDKSVLVEEVFSKLYTNEKFKEVKEQVYAGIRTFIELVMRMGSYVVYKAEEQIVQPFWKEGFRTYEVTIDKDMGVFKCSCQLFEFKGILCKHIIQCIVKENIKSIPETYILDRWRKDLIRGYEHIRVGDYNPEEVESVKRAMKVKNKNAYIEKFSLHNDETYTMYEKVSDDFVKQLENIVGIETVRSTLDANGISKVVGRRRTQPRECNMRHIARNTTQRSNSQLKDPIDKRGTGRGPKPKQTTTRKRKGGDIPQSPLSQRSRVSSELDLFR